MEIKIYNLKILGISVRKQIKKKEYHQYCILVDMKHTLVVYLLSKVVY